MHLKTFQLTDEGFNQPVIDLEIAKSKEGLNSEEFKVLYYA